MNHKYEYCPNCKLIRKMGVTISLKRIGPTQDECDEILMWTYHCDNCFSFVRMEPIDQIEKIGYNAYQWSKSLSTVG
jgi:hypothetical protein